MKKDKKKIKALGYTSLKGRIIYTAITMIVIFIGIKIIDSKSLHTYNLNFRTSEVGQYLDLMSIFVFVYSMYFMLYSSLGVYDAFDFMTSHHSYSPLIFTVIMVALGVMMAFTGIDTIGRMFEMNGLLVARHQNTFSGTYLFASALKAVLYSVLMYVVRVASTFVMKKQNEHLMKNNMDMRSRRERLEKMFKESE